MLYFPRRPCWCNERLSTLASRDTLTACFMTYFPVSLSVDWFVFTYQPQNGLVLFNSTTWLSVSSLFCTICTFAVEHTVINVQPHMNRLEKQSCLETHTPGQFPFLVLSKHTQLALKPTQRRRRGALLESYDVMEAGQDDQGIYSL